MDCFTVGMFDTRRKMNAMANIELSEATKRLDIMAWGLKSFREAKTELLKERIALGLKVRILAPKPDSIVVRWREIDEGVPIGSIKEEICDLAGWARTFDGAVKLRFYDSLPQSFYFRADNTLFIGPYWVGKDSQETISFRLKHRQTLKKYRKYFGCMWDNACIVL